MRKNIFITGAAGFIGFHLAKALHRRGDHVIGYDNFNDYYCPRLKRDRQQELEKEGIRIVEGDICNLKRLNESVQNHKATHIVHLAAQAGVRYSLINPQVYVKTNLEGFLNILEVCRSSPSLSLTYASSSSVYGLNSKTPFSVGDRTEDQASLYGVTKYTNELMARTYHHLFGVRSSGLRFFTVYGPWGRPDMAYYSFADAISTGKPIELYNQGNMSRDFTYIDDIVDGTIAAIDLEARSDIFNLGGHRPEELMHLVSCLEKGLRKKAVIKKLPMQPGDVYTTYADIERSRNILKFSPKTSLEEGVKQFIDWYLEYGKASAMPDES